MAPLNPNNTERYKVFYTGSGHQHVMDVRTYTMSPATFGGYIDTLFTAVTGLLFDTTIDDVQYAASGSNVFNSVTSGIEGNTYGGGGSNIASVARYMSFVGRSTGGRRVKLFIFGTNSNAIDYRYVAGEDAGIDAACAELNAVATAFLSIDDLKPVWKSYANAGQSAYWQKRLRP